MQMCGLEIHLEKSKIVYCQRNNEKMVGKNSESSQKISDKSTAFAAPHSDVKPGDVLIIGMLATCQ